MKTLTLILFVLLIENFIYAQKDTLGKSKYNCSIDLINTPNYIKGDIYQVTDSTIIIKHLIIQGSKSKDWSYILVPVYAIDIERIIVNKKGSGGKGFLIGGVVGSLFGALLLYASGDDQNSGYFAPDAEEKAVIGAIIFFIPGAIIGATHTHRKARKEIIIEGKKEIYISRMEELKSYSIKQ